MRQTTSLKLHLRHLNIGNVIHLLFLNESSGEASAGELAGAAPQDAGVCATAPPRKFGRSAGPIKRAQIIWLLFIGFPKRSNSIHEGLQKRFNEV